MSDNLSNEDLDKIQPEPIDQLKSTDSAKKAEQEEKDLFDRNDKKRDDNIKGHVHSALVAFIYSIVAIGVAIILVRGLHLLLPIQFCWLTPERIQEMDKLVFSGALGGIVVGYFKRQIK